MEEIGDNIQLQVNDAFLKTKEAEKNILTVKKATEQAKENYRINQERYNELLLEKFYQVGLLVAAPANPIPGD